MAEDGFVFRSGRFELPPARLILPVVGWREWLALPELGVDWVKAKIDTGARTSALHAFNVSAFTERGESWVRFEVHPWQRDNVQSIIATAPLVEMRHIRSSNGKEELRPVIATVVRLADVSFVAEITLTRRDVMGFRMLLGRQAIRDRFLIDPGRSYRGTRPKRRASTKTA
ncbi:MAG: ATP-dependent zinc protease [Myxococcales bacterium]|nr:ATP-dependent zinc protease [Myxococcales bacterium]